MHYLKGAYEAPHLILLGPKFYQTWALLLLFLETRHMMPRELPPKRPISLPVQDNYRK